MCVSTPDYNNAISLACDTVNEKALACNRHAAAVRQLSNGNM